MEIILIILLLFLYGWARMSGRNWSYHLGGWEISWFNSRNLPVCQDYHFKKIFHLLYKKYGMEFVHSWDRSYVTWQTSKMIYWFLFRESSIFDEKGRWCIRFFKSPNNPPNPYI